MRRYRRVVLIWPIALPGTGELRTEIDAEVDDVRIERDDDGALILTRGENILRIERPEIEMELTLDGVGSARSHLANDGVTPERDGDTVVLYRPVGDAERALVEASGWRTFPPRLPDQPIFYPVTNAAYAREIAEGWNVPTGSGVHILRFRIPATLASRWPVRCVGARHHTELWVPAEDLEQLNAAICGRIEET